ncbi:hypothetical protein GOV09_02610 [Candidatus Woesearchaeota archaeon]|nr:hypothetical protein [Candidatus Woesearchaeota archaeon]
MKQEKMIMGLLAVAMIVVIFNSYQIAAINIVESQAAKSTKVELSAKSDIIPSGVPEIYGEELQLSYDDVSPYDPARADLTIKKLAQFDRTMNLGGADKERYINALYKLEDGISCEYCCGARSIIFENGESACGCAHSYAMRGLAKYLITEHGDEYTDEEILAEVGKWKALFFPTQMQQKAEVLTGQGIELSGTNLASNKYRGIEKGLAAGGGMVGGC